jgi:uncharacterized protein YceK
MHNFHDTRNVVVLLAAAFLLTGCLTYTLVAPGPVSVARGTMTVQPSIAWNRMPHTAYDIPTEEVWTQNGPLLDSITFIGAVKDGNAIARQQSNDDQKVPVFRSNMTPQDLASMVESYYRIKAGVTVFETTEVKPVSFLGTTGMQLDYRYVGIDEVKRTGRAVLAISNGSLYMMALDGASLHYFDAALPEFEALVSSATAAS